MSLSDHIARAAQLVDDAAQAHQDAVQAHKRGDDKAVGEAHVMLGRCLRSAQQAFRDLAAAGAAQDSENTKTIQTSSGTDVSGGSANGRSPLMNGDIGGWLQRARIGGRS